MATLRLELHPREGIFNAHTTLSAQKSLTANMTFELVSRLVSGPNGDNFCFARERT